MMHTPKPQRPVPGQPPTPPHSQNNSMHAQDSTGSSSMRSPMTSPPPQDMVPFRGIYQSPAPMLDTPAYPMSNSSQNTIDWQDPTVQRLLHMLQQNPGPQQQRPQPEPQSPPQRQRPLPPVQMPRTHHYQQQRPMPQDSGYGSTYGDHYHYGAHYDYRPQGYTQPRGNKYGMIEAHGQSRVLMGNVTSPEVNPYMVREQVYAGAKTFEKAKLVATDMDHEGMRIFFEEKKAEAR
ncbi:hypothetical protein LTR64_008160 [Lithohypha guttulata]|uniref:uncharacterized protein n=1 Tax=Lithohypha guttulata TaxID=1690604 RepID=UPI002DE1B01A|nr:hypothetical protein LTR51_008312 [Lithohypha guttulata]